MTKLVEWVVGIVLILSIWIQMINNIPNYSLLQRYEAIVYIFPLLLVFAFAMISGFIVLYRVFTFNDCNEAVLELQQQIQEAEKDLISKGFQFTTQS